MRLRNPSRSLTPGPSKLPKITYEDVDEILAYLHFCWINDESGTRFKGSVVGHLRSSLGKEFTFKQIDQKIRYLWRTESVKAAVASSDHTSIYRYGISNLRSIAEDRYRFKHIRRRVEEIRQGKVLLPRASYSVQTQYGKEIADSFETTISSTNSGYRTRARTILNTVSPSRKTLGLENFSTQEESVRITEIPHTPSSVYEDVPSVPPSPLRLATPVGDHQQSPRPGTISPFSTTSNIVTWPVTSVPELKSEPSIQHWLSLTESNQAQPFEDTPNSMAATCSFHLGNERIWETIVSNNNESDAEYYRKKYLEAQAVIKELEKNKHCITNAEAILADQRLGSADKILELYLKEIENYKDKLNDKETLQPFTRGAGHCTTTFDRKYVVCAMKSIGHRIMQSMLSAETVEFFAPTFLDQPNQDLRMLCKRIFGVPNFVSKPIPFHCLLQSLVSAAVCEWVLESDFKDERLGSTRLFEIFLEHLLTQDGEDVVRNLHFAANSTLLEDEYSQEKLIPGKAENLATRFVSLISSMLFQQKEHNSWELDVNSYLVDQKSRLKIIFEDAYKVKVKTILSKDIFEVVFPVCGSEIEQKSMHEAVRESGDWTYRPEQPHRILVPLTPGLRKYRFDRMLVNYNSFRKPGSTSERWYDILAECTVLPE